ncbi:MAG: hypothetical protein WC620_04380 [Methanoregula sp.]
MRWRCSRGPVLACRLEIACTRRAPELALTEAFGRVSGTGKGWATPETEGQAPPVPAETQGLAGLAWQGPAGSRS